MGVAGLERSRQVRDHTGSPSLVHTLHPLNLLASLRSHTRLHSQWDDPWRVGGCLLRQIGSLGSTKVISRSTCQSNPCVCVSRGVRCIFKSVSVSVNGKAAMGRHVSSVCLLHTTLLKPLFESFFCINNTYIHFGFNLTLKHSWRRNVIYLYWRWLLCVCMCVCVGLCAGPV